MISDHNPSQMFVPIFIPLKYFKIGPGDIRSRSQDVFLRSGVSANPAVSSYLRHCPYKYWV